MKILTSKKELNVFAHYMLADKVKITKIDNVNGIEIEAAGWNLLPAMKFALMPQANPQNHAITVRITEFGLSSSWLPTALAKGLGMAASAIGPDVATVLADASGGIITREARNLIRVNLEVWRRRYHLKITPVISSIDLGENRLSIALNVA